MSTQLHLAQINIAKIIAPLDSPVMADFTNNLDRINILAEESPGFVWRLKDETNNATSIKIFDDDAVIVNMSAWNSIDDLFAYVYKSNHVEFFKRRHEWFHKMAELQTALWYVASDHFPTPEEGKQKLMHLQKHCESPIAFTFKKRFTKEEYLNFVADSKVTTFSK